MLVSDNKFVFSNCEKIDLKNYLRITNISSYYVFENFFLKVLWRHALIKNKTITANHAPLCHKNYEKSNNEKDRAAT